MTLREIQESDKRFLTPGDICGILGSNPQTIRVTARQQPALLGFPFTFTGNRMKIPRIPFLLFLGAETEKATMPASIAADPQQNGDKLQ